MVLRDDGRPEHPRWLDYEWIGCDAVGRVAVFTTGGPGPIPTLVLEDRGHADAVADFLSRLLRRGGGTLLVSVPRPDDFVRFGEQGLFSYDWRDTHRVAQRTGRYEIRVRPAKPISAAEMRGEYRGLLGELTFGSIRFDQTDAIDVRAFFRCEP